MAAKDLKDKLQRARAQVDRIKEKAEATMQTAKASVETVGTAFGFGYLRGRMTDPADPESFTVMGVEPDLLAGVGLHAVGFLGGFGKYAEDAHNVANGCLSSYAVTKGVEIGVDAREESEGTSGVGHVRQQLGAPSSVGPVSRRQANLAEQMASSGAASSPAGA